MNPHLQHALWHVNPFLWFVSVWASLRVIASFCILSCQQVRSVTRRSPCWLMALILLWWLTPCIIMDYRLGQLTYTTLNRAWNSKVSCTFIRYACSVCWFFAFLVFYLIVITFSTCCAFFYTCIFLAAVPPNDVLRSALHCRGFLHNQTIQFQVYWTINYHLQPALNLIAYCTVYFTLCV